MRDGVGYIAVVNLYQMLDIIANAVETVGAANFDSQALYDAAESYSLVIDDIPRYTFGPNKRCSNDFYAMYEARADEENLFRLHTDWYPAVHEP